MDESELKGLDLRGHLRPGDAQLRRLEALRQNYRLYATDPQNATPSLLVFTPVAQPFTLPQQLNDPRKMLLAGLNKAQAHLAVGGDALPALRVEFGTGQVAHAYGCGLFVPEDSPPCAQGHVLDSAEAIQALENPAPGAGLFGRLEEYHAFYRENKPDFLPLQPPDLQGPFNNAHLVRGNDILYDFYDEPELVDLLLQKVTDYQIGLNARMRHLFDDDGYFCDWGAAWKGGMRISNCSLHMISTRFYLDFIQKHDQRLIDAAGGGRIHYCGTHDDGLFDAFFAMPNMTGVDFDGAYHDIWELAERAPEHITLLQYTSAQQAQRLLAGDWPKKRNVIFQLSAPSVEEGRDLLKRLRAAMPY